MITQDGHGNGNYADLDYSGIHQFLDDDDQPYGSFEVFQGLDVLENDNCDCQDLNGWYWWPCFAGCLPDGDPIGPFATSSEAYHDAQGY